MVTASKGMVRTGSSRPWLRLPGGFRSQGGFRRQLSDRIRQWVSITAQTHRHLLRHLRRRQTRHPVRRRFPDCIPGRKGDPHREPGQHTRREPRQRRRRPPRSPQRSLEKSRIIRTLRPWHRKLKRLKSWRQIKPLPKNEKRPRRQQENKGSFHTPIFRQDAGPLDFT